MCGSADAGQGTGDPVKESIMHQKKTKKGSQEIKDKNTSRRLTEKSEEEIRTKTIAINNGELNKLILK